MKHKIRFTTTQLIMLSFLGAILVGSILLTLPISSSGERVPYVDALFTATTSICVTGLVTVTTASAWSTFGHIVILCLIQIGGLGIITIISAIMVILNKKIGMNDRILLQDTFNLNSLFGIVRFLKNVIIGTLVVEGAGALLYMLVFVPEFGLRGIWYSIFNSVSAFCNAGMDIIGENSMCNYKLNPIVNTVTNLLIILGGIGYIVWWDVIRVIKELPKKKWKCFSGLTLHSKIALSTTGILVFGGMLLILLFEYNNPLTIGNYNLFDKLQISLFQSVTTRTAGFVSVPQKDITNASALISVLLMFFGGSPVGTAGGVKTVTIAVLLCSAFATITNRNDVEMFNRRISAEAVKKSVAVVATSFVICFTSTLLLSLVCNADMLDIVYETVSATATVGLSRDLTPTLNVWGKIIIITTMYLGRVGPISLVIAFTATNQKTNIIKSPTEEISVG